MSDQDHPFLRPLWRRIVLVAICVGWSIVEFASAQPFWGMLAAGMAAYGAWLYLWTYPRPPQ